MLVHLFFDAERRTGERSRAGFTYELVWCKGGAQNHLFDSRKSVERIPKRMGRLESAAANCSADGSRSVCSPIRR